MGKGKANGEGGGTEGGEGEKKEKGKGSEKGRGLAGLLSSWTSWTSQQGVPAGVVAPGLILEDSTCTADSKSDGLALTSRSHLGETDVGGQGGPAFLIPGGRHLDPGEAPGV